MSQKDKWAIDFAGAMTAFAYAALAYGAGQAQGVSLVLFYAVMAVALAVCYGLFFWLQRAENRGSDHIHASAHAKDSWPLARLLAWALIFRLIGIVGDPVLEDDFYRYLWDGYLFWREGTPYGVAPMAYFQDSTVAYPFNRILDQINHPDLPTIYGPVLQYLFALAHWLSPGNILGLKLLLVAADLALIGCLAYLAKPQWVYLYAWCPLVIKEVAFTAHPDGVGVLLMVAALVTWHKGLFRWTALLLAAAVAAKVFALLMVPLLLRASWRHWLLFGLALLTFYAPFLLQGGTDLTSLGVFAQFWEFNSFAFGLATLWLSPDVAKILLGSLFMLWYGYYCLMRYRRGEDSLPRGDWVFGLFLLIAPTVNAWYLLWLLPFAVLFPSFWAWMASAVVLLSYIVGLHAPALGLDAYEQPLWARYMQAALIVGAKLIDVKRHWSMRTGGSLSQKNVKQQNLNQEKESAHA